MKIKSIKAIGQREVYDITVKDVHHYCLGNGVVTHNTAVTYSANQIFVITKSQEKASDGELQGWNFTLGVFKSRYVREKVRLPFTVHYEGGIQKYSGMMDIAIELGAIVKPSQGWYSRVDLSTGEVEAKKWRAKDMETDEFWLPVIESKEFKKKVEDFYLLGQGALISDEEIDSAIQDEDE